MKLDSFELINNDNDPYYYKLSFSIDEKDRIFFNNFKKLSINYLEDFNNQFIRNLRSKLFTNVTFLSNSPYTIVQQITTKDNTVNLLVEHLITYIHSHMHKVIITPSILVEGLTNDQIAQAKTLEVKVNYPIASDLYNAYIECTHIILDSFHKEADDYFKRNRIELIKKPYKLFSYDEVDVAKPYDGVDVVKQKFNVDVEQINNLLKYFPKKSAEKNQVPF